MYADISDQASDHEAREREAAIQAVRNAPAVPRTGRCHWCDAPTSPEAVYCDYACLSDHAKAREAAKRNGQGCP